MKNSKIGILTFHYPSNKNFGGILQAYAVQKMFENQGNKVELINLIPFKETIKTKISTYITGNGFIDFSNKFLKVSNQCKTLEDLKMLNLKMSTFVVGSDQVWRPTWLKSYLSHYYFDFVDDKNKKIAYAASFGTDNWDGGYELTTKIKKLIQRFDYISVREESGVKICKEKFGVDATCVLDPTLMIDKNDYKIILDDYNSKHMKKEKFIAYMLLDDNSELRHQSKIMSNYLSVKNIHINGKFLFKNKFFIYNKVSCWLNYIKNSELVVTDSFHCTVFSLIFNKKFVVVANPTRGTARLENLLGIVGLKERFFTDIKDVLKSGILDKDIDYVEVEKKLNIHREYSMNFLKKALGESNE